MHLFYFQFIAWTLIGDFLDVSYVTHNITLIPLINQAAGKNDTCIKGALKK